METFLQHVRDSADDVPGILPPDHSVIVDAVMNASLREIVLALTVIAVAIAFSIFPTLLASRDKEIGRICYFLKTVPTLLATTAAVHYLAADPTILPDNVRAIYPNEDRADLAAAFIRHTIQFILLATSGTLVTAWTVHRLQDANMTRKWAILGPLLLGPLFLAFLMIYGRRRTTTNPHFKMTDSARRN